MAKDNLAGRMLLRLYLTYTDNDLSEPGIKRPRTKHGVSVACPYNLRKLKLRLAHMMPAPWRSFYMLGMPHDFKVWLPGGWRPRG